MKVTIEFNLPEEASELRHALEGEQWLGILFDLDQDLRRRIKNPTNGEELGASTARVLAREFIRDEMTENGLVFDE